MNGQMQKKGQGNTVFSTLKIPQYWCDVCKLDCESSRSLATHFNGKKHRNALKQAEEFGSTDQQNDLEMDSLNPVPVAKQEPLEGQMLSSETSCAICHIVCPNAQSLASHLVGKKHQKKISMETKDAGSPRSEPRNYVSASEQ
ncbi:hypothetical protein KP509_01G115100 [Ceratopteris richardii]|nr:hypothetical protein KP509_01G115100 [Ceratopteris richardii]